MMFKINNINEYKNYEMSNGKWFDAVSHNNIELIRNYINNGFDINIEDSSNESALMLACRLDNLDVVKELLKQPVLNVNVINEFNKRTVLTITCLKNYITIVKELLKRTDIDINSQDSCGNSALIWSCGWNYLTIVKELLNYPNIDVNLLNNYGDSALFYAKRVKNNEMIKLLKETGAKE